MNEDIKERWITALESGEYTKTEGHLKNDSGYCALGVLADIAVRDGLAEWDQMEADNSYNSCTCTRCHQSRFLIKAGGYRDAGALPRPLAEWADLTPQNQAMIYDRNDEWMEDEQGEAVRPTVFHDVAIFVKEHL